MNGITYSDQPIKKLYWTIGEVSKELNIAPSAIHFWMREFDIHVKRSRHNNRLFTDEDKTKLREVYFLLKVELFTVAGAKRKLSGLI